MRVDVRPRQRNSGKADAGRRCPSHLQWLRGRACCVEAKGGCSGKIQAAHVDNAGGKGMALKVADWKAVPACAGRHEEMHRGAKSFEAKYRIDLVAAAAAYAAKSPHRAAWAGVQ